MGESKEQESPKSPAPQSKTAPLNTIANNKNKKAQKDHKEKKKRANTHVTKNR